MSGRRFWHRPNLMKRSGFTLAEMIAAIALLAVFSVVVVQLFAASHRLAQRTDRLDGAVLCARNIAEAWQANLTTVSGPAASALPANPLAGAGDLRMGKPARLGFDSAQRPVAPTDAGAVFIAELTLSDHQPNGTDELGIIVRDSSGAELFKMTAARLIREGVAR